jgi:hypothetical protein
MPGSRVPKSERLQPVALNALVEKMSELISLRERVAQAELVAPLPFSEEAPLNEEVSAGRHGNSGRPRKRAQARTIEMKSRHSAAGPIKSRGGH